jgi:hypothetical protein
MISALRIVVQRASGRRLVRAQTARAAGEQEISSLAPIGFSPDALQPIGGRYFVWTGHAGIMAGDYSAGQLAPAWRRLVQRRYRIGCCE